MSESQNTPVEEEKALVTPAKTEEAVHAAVDEVVPDGLLIEEDGDPFWVIQQVFWGILKTAALLGLLLFLIWLVWRPSSFLNQSESSTEFAVEPAPVVEEFVAEEESGPGFWQRLFGGGDEEVPAEVPIPKETTKTPTTPVTPPQKTVNTPVTTTEDTGTQAAYQLEEDRTLLVRGIIPQSVQWLREAKTVGEISMTMVREGTPAIRSRQVEEILAAADDLFVRSANLQSQLQNERIYFLEAGEAANARTTELEQSITARLEVLDPVPVEGLLAEKVLSQQNASYYLSNAKIRDTLLKNVQTFDQLLRRQSIPLLNPATQIRAN